MRAGACLRVLKPEWTSDFSSQGSERPPQVAGYRAHAKRVKLGIQRRRYPANPKKDSMSAFDGGSGRVDIRDFLSVVIYLLVGNKRTLR